MTAPTLQEQIDAVQVAAAHPPWVEVRDALSAAVETLRQVERGELVPKGSDPLPNDIQWALNSDDGIYRP